MAPDVRLRALHYGRECANGYLELLDHVLLVRREFVSSSSYQPPRVQSSSRTPQTQLCNFLFKSPPLLTILFPKSVLISKPPFPGAPSFLASLVLPLTSSSPFSYFLSSHLTSSFLPSSPLLSSHFIILPAPCQPVSDTQPRCLYHVCGVHRDGQHGACGLWREAAMGWCWRPTVCSGVRSG